MLMRITVHKRQFRKVKLISRGYEASCEEKEREIVENGEKIGMKNRKSKYRKSKIETRGRHQWEIKVLDTNRVLRKLRSCRERMICCAHSRAFPLCYFRAESPFKALNRTDFPTKKVVCNIVSTCWNIAEYSPWVN